jgi:hypothetical protein
MEDNQFSTYTLGKPHKWLIDAAAELNIDISLSEHEVSNYFINHSINRHGNQKIETAQGQLPITEDDIAFISAIVRSPDYAIIGIKRNNERLIAYAKYFESWTAIYYEEILNSRKNKALRSKTMYKKMGLVSKKVFIKIVSNNAHTDLSDIKIVVGAGGNPGGEAD